MLISHKVELRPTARQGEYFRRCAGTMRFVFNQLVAKWKAGEKYNRKEFQKFCVELRQSTEWMNRVTSRATYEAADNFHKSVSAFFRDCKKKSGKRFGSPQFKKRGVKDGFQFSHPTQFATNGRSLRVQGLKSHIPMRERIRFYGTVKSVSIKLHAGKWYATFLVEMPDRPVSNLTREPSVGIDLGLKHLAVLSTGEVIENPRPLKRSLKLLRRRQRQVSRKFLKGKRQSNRFQKAAACVARIHKKVADQRSYAQHKFTSDVVRRFSRITIEDLNVTGLQKNRRLARSISDASWSTIRWQLEYKCRQQGVDLVVADRFFASSKTCSNCHYKVEKLKLSQRTFFCSCCGLLLDRDLNAAINLDRYESTTPPIRGSRKTDALDLRKSSSEAGSFEGVNINPVRKNEGRYQPHL